VSKSIILCEVTFLLTLACKIVKGFARPFLGLGIKRDRNRAVNYYNRETGPSKG
jgi:hypothetical protein